RSAGVEVWAGHSLPGRDARARMPVPHPLSPTLRPGRGDTAPRTPMDEPAMKQPSGLFASVVLAAFLAVGFAAVWGVLLKWGSSTVRRRAPARVDGGPLFLADGPPVVERVSRVRGVSVVPPSEQFRDLEGNPVTVPADARWATGVSLYGGRAGEGLLAG